MSEKILNQNVLSYFVYIWIDSLICGLRLLRKNALTFRQNQQNSHEGCLLHSNGHLISNVAFNNTGAATKLFGSITRFVGQPTVL